MTNARPSPLSASSPRLADLPAHVPFVYGDTSSLPVHELQVAGWEKGKRPPIFHAYTQEIAQYASRRFFIHVSAVDGEPPFLWLSHNQYKTCRAGHSYFERLDLLPVVEGLVARWHILTLLVSYDFAHVVVNATNASGGFDQITWVRPGETKTKRFSLTTSGDIPVIASPLRRRAMMMEFL